MDLHSKNQEPPKNPPTPDEISKKTAHVLQLIIVGILCFVVIIFVFGVGVFVGQERAEFSFRWAQNYHYNFGGPRMGLFSNFPNRDFINAHGIFGSVIKIDGNNLIIKGQDNIERTVTIIPHTTLVNSAGPITLENIKINDMVIVIGSPDDKGQIQAQFIRILPVGTSYISGFHINNI